MSKSLFRVAVLLFLATCSSLVASADTLVVGSADDGENCFPFGCTYSGEYQQVYSSSAFSGPITISGLDFYNTDFNSFSTESPAGNWTIYLSETSADPTALSHLFSDNITGPETEVFSGNLGQPWAFGDTLSIALSTPFNYDPSEGNLLMDVFASGVTDIPFTNVFFDATNSNQVGRVYDSGLGVTDSYGLVTGFEETPLSPIPEPSSWFLFATGAAFLTLALRRKRECFR